jgi:hypothetical protein
MDQDIPSYAGIVDQNIYPAELTDRPHKHSLYFFPVGNISADS